MSLHLPEGMRDTDDVAAAEVAADAIVHLPGTHVTACGEPMWAMHHPSAGHMARLSCRWCPSCWPPEASGWARLVELAYPSRFRTADVQGRRGFGLINDSPAAAPSNERSRG